MYPQMLTIKENNHKCATEGRNGSRPSSLWKSKVQQPLGKSTTLTRQGPVDIPTTDTPQEYLPQELSEGAAQGEISNYNLW